MAVSQLITQAGVDLQSTPINCGSVIRHMSGQIRITNPVLKSADYKSALAASGEGKEREATPFFY